MKIVVADDHAVVRQGYASLLSAMLAPCTVFEAGSAEQAYLLCTEERPDIVIMDVNMQGESGIDVTERIIQELPDQNVLFFSMYDEISVVSQAMRAGGKGYITKSCTPDILINAVKVVAAGGDYVEHELAIRMAVARPDVRRKGIDDMTRREHEIFIMLAEGKSSDQIAQELSITHKTVSNYTAILKGKLGIESTAELVHFAIDNGIIKPNSGK